MLEEQKIDLDAGFEHPEIFKYNIILFMLLMRSRKTLCRGKSLLVFPA